MAVITLSSVASAVSGSIGGSTFRTFSFKATLSKKKSKSLLLAGGTATGGSGTITPLASPRSVSAAWANLTLAEQKTWITAVANGTCSVGGFKTGYAAFFAYFQNAKAYKMGYPATCPTATYSFQVSNLDTFHVSQSPNSAYLQCFSPLDPDYYYLIRLKFITTTNYSKWIYGGWNYKAPRLFFGTTNSLGKQDCTSAFFNKYGYWTSGQHFAVRLDQFYCPSGILMGWATLTDYDFF